MLEFLIEEERSREREREREMNRLAFVTLFIVSAVTRVQNSSAQPKIPDDVLLVNMPSDVGLEYASKNNLNEPVAWQCTETCDFGGRMFGSSKAKAYAEEMTRLAKLPPSNKTSVTTPVVPKRKMPDLNPTTSFICDDRVDAYINGEDDEEVKEEVKEEDGEVKEEDEEVKEEERFLDLAKRGAVKTLSPLDAI